MDDQRVGRVLRALRRRRGWRQVDIARAADCSQRTVSRAEAGHLPSVSILRRLLAALDASLALEVRWRAGALDRLLDEAHARLVGQVAVLLSKLGWVVEVEVTYARYREQGSIDILAFWPPLGMLLVVEIKTDLPSIEATLRKLDEKVRLAPVVARDRFGWEVATVGRLVAMPETSTLRRRVSRHDGVLRSALPQRGTEIRTWLARPAGRLAGIWLLSPSHAVADIRGRGGPTRVREPKRSSPSQPAAA